MRFGNSETPTLTGSAGTGHGSTSRPAVVERMNLFDDLGNVVAYFEKDVDGTTSLSIGGAPVGGGTYAVASNSPANGTDTAFTFSGTPVMVFRNGVMENRLGAITTNTFTFDSAPSADDDIEALV